jgi:ubiquinone/menaquinone biosynthesis C-methylase UbiE
MSQLLSNTSERVIEEHYVQSRESYLIYLMHIATYNSTAPYVKGKTVLDMGCGSGSGYGTALIADKCASICGVDISAEAIAYATEKFNANNLSYKTISKVEEAPLPFADDSFDVVLSFKVIEHIADPTVYLQEIRRVLKKGGVFIVATPDRSTRLLPMQRPWNKFHVHEYAAQEFSALIGKFFANVQLLQMSGTKSVLEMELKRTKHLMWMTLPFTFPLVPEWLRIFGLSLMTQMRKLLSSNAAMAKAPVFDFDVSDVHIGKDLVPSVNLIAIAQKV